MKPLRVTSSGICTPTRCSGDLFVPIICTERAQNPWPWWRALILGLGAFAFPWWTANEACSRPHSPNIRCIASAKIRYATQSHDERMRALATATREAVRKAGIAGEQVKALAVDTTGSSAIPVGKNLEPLDEYYLWCDHRAKLEAAEITTAAHRENLAAIQWCGGVYSSEWGFSKLLHWLRGQIGWLASGMNFC
jgi:ribulose kinase